MKHILSICLAFVIAHTAHSQITKLSNATISGVSFDMSTDKKMVITYDIVGGKPSEKFDITLTIITDSGNKLETKTISGDLKGVPAGSGKRIIWDIGKDIAYLDENIHVEIEAKQINPKVIPYTSKGKAIVWSTFLPGAGSTRLGQNGVHILKGIAAYALIGLSVKFNNDAVKAYDSYKLATTATERNDFLSQTESKQNLSNFMVYGAVTVWVVDYLNIMLMKNKTDKRKGKVSFHPAINPYNGKPNLAFVWSF
ncbi:MAG: hypothetical protein AB9846_05330 [Tenuifilaceae bacterium]